MTTNELSTNDEHFELPATAFGCAPREATTEDDNLLKLLIGHLDELTRPDRPGRLK